MRLALWMTRSEVRLSAAPRSWLISQSLSLPETSHARTKLAIALGMASVAWAMRQMPPEASLTHSPKDDIWPESRTVPTTRSTAPTISDARSPTAWNATTVALSRSPVFVRTVVVSE